MMFKYIKSDRYFLIYFVYLFLQFGLSFQATKLDYIQNHVYESSAEEVPRKLQILTNITFSNGIPDDLLNFYTPVFSKTTQCKIDSELYKEKLKQFEPWAVKMWDSSGKIPSGMMHANFHDFGNYAECMEVPEIAPYHVKHCTIQLGNLVSVQTTGIDWNVTDTAFGSLPLVKPHFYFGRCLPASCTDEDLYEHFQKVINPYNLTFRIDKYSCTATNEDKSFSLLDWATICYTATIVTILGISTLFDLTASPNKKEVKSAKIILAFSMYSNYKKITNNASSNKPLTALHGLRSIAMIWVMCGHYLLFSVLQPTINFLPMTKLQESKIGAIFASGAMAVDVFIVLSGFLVSYSLTEKLKNGIKFNFSVYYIHRLVRILPSYMTQILHAVAIFHHLGAGPSWKSNIERTRDNCIKNWWTNLLFINNFVEVEEMCIPSTWYLAVDTQLYAMAPFALFCIYKWKVFRRYILPLLIIFFDVWTSMTSYSYKFKAGAVFQRDLSTEMTKFLYISIHGRMGVWLLGISLGYYLQMNSGKVVKLSKMTVGAGWFMALIIQITMPLTLSVFMTHGNYLDNVLHAFYNGFHRTLYSICICWVIFACELGYGGFMHTFLSWWPFQIFSKISFMLYIFHVAFMYAMKSINIGTHEFNMALYFRDMLGDIVACIPLAMIMSMMYELPYINIGKILLKSNNEKVPEAKVVGIETTALPTGNQQVNLQQLKFTIHHEQNGV